MTHFEIVTKLIGKINPVGESNADNERFENLKALCELANEIVTAIDYVSYNYKNSREFSVNRASEYAKKFLTEELGIKE